MWQTFLTWLSAVGHYVLSFTMALAESIAANGGQVLVDAAEAGVLAAEETGGDSDAKFAAAQSAVIAKLQAEGIPVVMNAVNGAIESAVAKLHALQTTDSSASTGATPAPVAPPVPLPTQDAEPAPEAPVDPAPVLPDNVAAQTVTPHD